MFISIGDKIKENRMNMIHILQKDYTCELGNEYNYMSSMEVQNVIALMSLSLIISSDV